MFNMMVLVLIFCFAVCNLCVLCVSFWKKTMKISEEKPRCHKIIGAVASGQIKKQETSRRLRNRQKLEAQLRSNDESVNITKKEEVSRQRLLARKLVKIPINFSLVPPDQSFCKETCHLFQKMIDSARENVPETVLGLLRSRLMEKFGPSYRSFVYRLWARIWLKVHLRCLQEDAGISDEGMAKIHPLHLLKLLDGVNITHTPSLERLASEFGLHTPDIITELVENMVKAFAEVAPDEAMTVFANVARERQRMLARKLVKIPIDFSLVPPDQKKETNYLFQKMIDSARENVPGAVLGLLRSRLTEKFGPSYRTFVYRLWENIWLKVHLRCLQEDAGGLSDEGMAKMHPLHLLKLLDGVNNTHAPSVERKMMVLVREFGLDTPCSYPVQDIITELVEKVVKAFAMVAPDNAKAVFAKVAHEDAMDHAMALAVRGISLAS